MTDLKDHVCCLSQFIYTGIDPPVRIEAARDGIEQVNFRWKAVWVRSLLMLPCALLVGRCQCNVTSHGLPSLFLAPNRSYHSIECWIDLEV